MALTLYNSLTRRKEEFRPLDPQNVRMYVCGPTVYDEAHIGNARAVTVFDLLYRMLRHEYGESHVKYVRNITDVEDKIMARARESGQTIDQVTSQTTAVFHEDMAGLGNLPPDVEPRATEYIKPMIALIERLIASGHAYAAEGHALFRVASYPKYGALSRRSRKDMIAGARVEVAPYKEDPGDFVLWKPSTPDQPGWDSPWGRGRPGWHIECSAMSEHTLGETFDIHGGGLDLIFPHHENEIAQSVCAHDGGGPQDFARVWMHNGMLTVGGAKMAKSDGNFVTVRQALALGANIKKQGEIIRLALLSTHYRAPLDWTEDRLHEAQQTLDRFYRVLTLPGIPPNSPPPLPDEVLSAIRDDLNFPATLTCLHQLTSDYHTSAGDDIKRGLRKAQLLAAGNLLGLLESDPDDYFHGNFERQPVSGNIVITRQEAPDHPRSFVHSGAQGQQVSNRTILDNDHVKKRIAARTLARKERRFADADRIRDELAAEGVLLEDGPSGTTWRRG